MFFLFLQNRIAFFTFIRVLVGRQQQQQQMRNQRHKKTINILQNSPNFTAKNRNFAGSIFDLNTLKSEKVNIYVSIWKHLQ